MSSSPSIPKITSWSLLVAAIISFLIMTTVFLDAAPADERCYEMRTYSAAPGKLDALHARFRDHTLRLFAKHGIESIGYWVPIDNQEQKLIFLLGYPSRAERDVRWNAFAKDPEWVAAKAKSEEGGTLVTKVVQRFLKTTDFSKPVQAGVGAGQRVFELRTYITTPNNLDRLLKRFREHTTKLFERHGMTNLYYFTLLPDQPGAENTLVYFLAHASKEAGLASFTKFRQDPEWIAAKGASEKEGGGSLTVAKDGVVSEYLVATDYSPTK